MKAPAFILLFVLTLVACNNTGTGPSTGANLIMNSTFEVNGIPSLSGWIVPDTSAVHFSTNIPSTGSDHSIMFGVGWPEPWPGNSIYTTITGLSGTHSYRLSAFGKGVPIVNGGVYAYRGRPSISTSTLFGSLQVSDTVWTFYSRVDTLSATLSDTIFISITGGAAEVTPLTSIYFNTCKFEKLD